MHRVFRFCYTAIYSYFGQAFIACVPTVPTAQILAAVFIGLNNFFSGLIVRPQYLSGFFEIPYWITPGHFVIEGMVTSIFAENNNIVIAIPGSSFYDYMGCPENNVNADGECTGTVSDFVDNFFGGRFQKDHMWYDALVCGIFLLLARATTYFGLRYFNYMNA
jgi:ABC-type multidrug transport system permease subunit